MATGFSRIVGVQARYLREGRLGKALRGFTVLAERGLMRLSRPLGVGDHECCLCGWRGPLFLSAYYYDNYRPGVFCPQCGSAERHRTLKIFLEQELGDFFLERTRTVLDIAPIARSRELFAFAPVAYTSLDVSSPLAQVHGDLCRLCLPDDRFDFISCFHVLEHIADEKAALSELFRVLRPGGLALLQVPWDPCATETLEYGAPRESEEGHVRRYGRDVAERWTSVGFETLFSRAAYDLDDDLVRRHGLDRDILMLVRKP
ncbi:MAG: class I SAM-dependent methyltransferase [Planctomycetota bacterium]|jgi:SAM-dependent methyltransferase